MSTGWGFLRMTARRIRVWRHSQRVFKNPYFVTEAFDFLRERTPELQRAQSFARDRRIYSALRGAGFLP